MLDLKFIRDNPDVLRKALADRNSTAINVDELLALDAQARAAQHEAEKLRAQQNAASKDIGRLMKEKKKDEADNARAEVKKLSEEMVLRETRVKELRSQLDDLLLTIPNLPDPSLPVGADESSNRIERTWGEPRKFDFEPKDHVDLGEALGIIDFERAAKLSGARI